MSIRDINCVDIRFSCFDYQAGTWKSGKIEDVLYIEKNKDCHHVFRYDKKEDILRLLKIYHLQIESYTDKKYIIRIDGDTYKKVNLSEPRFIGGRFLTKSRRFGNRGGGGWQQKRVYEGAKIKLLLLKQKLCIVEKSEKDLNCSRESLLVRLCQKAINYL